MFSSWDIVCQPTVVCRPFFISRIRCRSIFLFHFNSIWSHVFVSHFYCLYMANRYRIIAIFFIFSNSCETNQRKTKSYNIVFRKKLNWKVFAVIILRLTFFVDSIVRCETTTWINKIYGRFHCFGSWKKRTVEGANRKRIEWNVCSHRSYIHPIFSIFCSTKKNEKFSPCSAKRQRVRFYHSVDSEHLPLTFHVLTK